MRIAVLILVFALSVHGRPLLAPMYRVDADKRIPGRYLVTLKEDSSAKICLDDVIREAGELTKDDSGNFFVAKRFQLLDMFVAEMSESALNLVRSMDAVAYVEEVSIFHLAAVSSWGLDRIDQRDLPLDDTFTPRGDGAGVNVYVVDTGIRYTHSDFNGRAKFFHDALVMT
ncbi:aqualysin-1-like [Ptychodera flava]|uniref:aqualysin-1-like n=1 Tax=Ptychodera flava TaxID=63121 RepID=UPI00396A984F